jgi:hypothetical protein
VTPKSVNLYNATRTSRSCVPVDLVPVVISVISLLLVLLVLVVYIVTRSGGPGLSVYYTVLCAFSISFSQ